MDSCNHPADLLHIKKLCQIEFSIHGKTCYLVLTRAFLVDNYKGLSHEPHILEFQNINNKKTNHVVPGKKKQVLSTPKSAKFYSSMYYTLSLLNDSNNSFTDCFDSDSDDSHKVNNLSIDNQVKVKDDLYNEISINAHEFEIESDMCKQMRLLGLPQSFGAKRYVKQPIYSGNKPSYKKKLSDTELSFLILMSNTSTKPPYSNIFSSKSTENISTITINQPKSMYIDDMMYNPAEYVLSSLCRTVELCCSFTHLHTFCPRYIHISLPAVCTRTSAQNNPYRDVQNWMACNGSWKFVPKSLSRSTETLLPSTQWTDLNKTGDTESMQKYWSQRYRLFSRFDEGIQIDQEGLFSVTPEVIAAHHAFRIYSALNTSEQCTVVDLFSGVGGNSIQLALLGLKVIAVDHSECMLKMAEVNARVYGVEDKIQFIKSDVFNWLNEAHNTSSFKSPLIVNSIFMSPPWGGPTYSQESTFDLDSMVFASESGTKRNLADLISLCSRLTTGPIVLFIPRNANIAQILHLQLKVFDEARLVLNGEQELKRLSIEVEVSLIHGKPKALTVYF